MDNAPDTPTDKERERARLDHEWKVLQQDLMTKLLASAENRAELAGQLDLHDENSPTIQLHRLRYKPAHYEANKTRYETALTEAVKDGKLVSAQAFDAYYSHSLTGEDDSVPQRPDGSPDYSVIAGINREQIDAALAGQIADATGAPGADNPNSHRKFRDTDQPPRYKYGTEADSFMDGVAAAVLNPERTAAVLKASNVTSQQVTDNLPRYLDGKNDADISLGDAVKAGMQHAQPILKEMCEKDGDYYADGKLELNPPDTPTGTYKDGQCHQR